MTLTDEILQVCRERFGAESVAINRRVDQPPTIGGVTLEPLDWQGVWFWLKVVRNGESKVLGRRRTVAELLELARTLPPEHVDGHNFGRQPAEEMPWRERRGHRPTTRDRGSYRRSHTAR